MKLQTSITTLSRSTLCWLLCLNLLLPGHLYANTEGDAKANEESQETNNKKEKKYRDWSKALDSTAGVLELATGAANFFSNKKAQEEAQEAAQKQMQARQLALTPIEFQNDYFPGCKTLPAMMSSIAGICEVTPNSQQEAQVFTQYYEAAKKNSNKYERYETQGNKQQINHGISCIDERLAETKDLLEQRIVSLKETQAQIHDAKSKLEEKLKPAKEAISELHGYLHGGSGIESNNTRKYSRLFREVANDRNCGSFLGKIQVEKFAQKGIKNIETQVNKIRTGGKGSGAGNDLVTHLLRNQGNIQASIRSYAREISTSINKRGASEVTSDKGGLTALNIPSSMNFDSSPAVQSLLKEQTRLFKDEKSVLERQFKKMGTKASKLHEGIFSDGDHNFNAKITSWRNDRQNSCLQKRMGSYDRFLKKLEHTDSRIRSTANITSLRQDLGNHLKNSRLSIEEKLKLVSRALRKKGTQQLQIMEYDTHDGKTIQKGWDPASLLKEYVGECLSRYERINENDENQSFKDMEKEARAIYTQYKKLEKKLPQKVSHALYDKMINCKKDGKPLPYSVSSQSCNSQKLTLSSPNFCLGQSVECAKNINSCSQKIEKTIINITKKLQASATVVNNEVQKFTQFKKGLLAKLKTTSLVQSKKLEKMFPNSKFHIPKDLTVIDAEKSFKLGNINKLDVSILDPEKSIADFDKKIEELIKNIEAQNQKVVEVLNAEREQILASYSKEKEKWNTLADNCQAQVVAYNQAAEERRREQERVRGEELKKLNKLCILYNKYRRAPACGTALEELDEAVMSVSHEINTGDIQQTLGNIRSNCAMGAVGGDGGDTGGGSSYSRNLEDCQNRYKDEKNKGQYKKGYEDCRTNALAEAQFNKDDKTPDARKTRTNLNHISPYLPSYCSAQNNSSLAFQGIGGKIIDSIMGTLNSYGTRE